MRPQLAVLLMSLLMFVVSGLEEIVAPQEFPEDPEKSDFTPKLREHEDELEGWTQDKPLLEPAIE